MTACYYVCCKHRRAVHYRDRPDSASGRLLDPVGAANQLEAASQGVEEASRGAERRAGGHRGDCTEPMLDKAGGEGGHCNLAEAHQPFQLQSQQRGPCKFPPILF